MGRSKTKIIWQKADDNDNDDVFLTDLALGRWRHVRVPWRADDVPNATDRDAGSLRHAGKRTGAIVGEVAIHFPGLAEVVRSLDEHGRRSERLEAHDEMREVKLRLQIELDWDFLLTVLSLPPTLSPVWPTTNIRNWFRHLQHLWRANKGPRKRGPPKPAA